MRGGGASTGRAMAVRRSVASDHSRRREAASCTPASAVARTRMALPFSAAGVRSVTPGRSGDSEETAATTRSRSVLVSPIPDGRSVWVLAGWAVDDAGAAAALTAADRGMSAARNGETVAVTVAAGSWL